jgi:serine/threonine-protein kinase
MTPKSRDPVALDTSWEHLEGPIRRFEAAWAAGTRPAIEDYLPDCEPTRLRVLVELVHTELEFRYRAGETAGVEDYFARFPELGDDDEVACGLRDAVDRWRRRMSKGREEVASPIPRRVGRYEVHEVIGRGAFGIVHRGLDTELGRPVAIKIPRPGLADRAGQVERILREARSAARLRHANVVTVLDAVWFEGVCYLVSEYVGGPTLADRLATGALPAREAAELVAKVADGLNHAHTHGIIHRDLKPSNILLDDSGQPHLADFGLAKDPGAATLTLDGQVLGTPAYLSPEQAGGERARVDPRSDIYSLGVILYQTLTGVLPFCGNPRVLLDQIQYEEPRPPRRLNACIPAALETICLKAMARQPEKRYATAETFADDLRRFLQGIPVLARPIGPVGRLWRVCRRRPAAALLCVALLVSVLAGMGGILWQWRRAEAHLARAHEQRHRLLRALHESNRTLGALTTLGGKDLAGSPDEHLITRAQVELLLRRFEDYADLIGQDPEALHESAATYENAGNYLRALGRPLDAAGQWTRAARQLERYALDHPAEWAAQQSLADLYRKLATLAEEEERKEDRRQLLETALPRALNVQQHWEQAVRPGSNDVEIQKELAKAYNVCGTILQELGRNEHAVATLGKAKTILTRLWESHIRDDDTAVQLAIQSAQIARIERNAGRYAAAVPDLRRARTIWEAFHAKHPEDQQASESLARVCYGLGEACRETHRLPEAQAALERARDLWVHLDGVNPAASRKSLSRVLRHLSAVLDRQGKTSDALVAILQAATCYEALMAAEPHVGNHRRGLSCCHHCEANLLVDLGRLEEASAAYRRALAIRETFCQDHLAQANDRRDLAGTCHNLAEVEEQRGRLIDAKALFERAVQQTRLALDATGLDHFRRDLEDHSAGLTRVSASLATRD